MTERETFDAAMKKVLSVSKQELQRRIEADKQRPRIGEKRGPKTASHVPGASARS